MALTYGQDVKSESLILKPPVKLLLTTVHLRPFRSQISLYVWHNALYIFSMLPLLCPPIVILFLLWFRSERNERSVMRKLAVRVYICIYIATRDNNRETYTAACIYNRRAISNSKDRNSNDILCPFFSLSLSLSLFVSKIQKMYINTIQYESDCLLKQRIFHHTCTVEKQKLIQYRSVK